MNCVFTGGLERKGRATPGNCSAEWLSLLFHRDGRFLSPVLWHLSLEGGAFERAYELWSLQEMEERDRKGN